MRATPLSALRHLRTARVPRVAENPGWMIQESSENPLRHRVMESLMTVGAGGIATRGAVEEPSVGSVPMVLVAGVYVGEGPNQHLLAAPDWTGLELSPPPVEDRHVLDMYGGVLLREEENAGGQPVRVLRFASAARPGLVAMRAEARAGRLSAGPALRVPGEGSSATGQLCDRWWARTTGQGSVTAVASQRQYQNGDTALVERIAVYRRDGAGILPLTVDVARLRQAERLGFDKLLAEHRAAWSERWAAVNIEIPAAPDIELGLRFAVFQLLCNVGGSPEAVVGARGLSGGGYAGHVFWDADVFVLPAIASIEPSAARAMLEYRRRCLPPARAAARTLGRAGARFPWESAQDGRDVTPTHGDLGGVAVDIRTGDLEEHITADVAWSAWHYATWTSDHKFLDGPGRALLVESARYWASRCVLDKRGRAHIGPVIGPDEYHEAVYDNAYTNVMARWNLTTAARLLDSSPESRTESARWRRLAEALVDGYQPETGRYEQFAGYFDLEPLRALGRISPPAAADVLLGRQTVAESQLIKQPDVLMLHHLVPDEVAPGSLVPNLDFYLPRTTHGSSLSPAISAALLARAGRSDEAVRMLRLALRLDLDDLTGMTANGLHMATLGGVWQAMLFGFLGARVRQGVLHLDPRLPRSWPLLRMRFLCMGRRVSVTVSDGYCEVGTNAPLSVCLPGHVASRVTRTKRWVLRRGDEQRG